MTKAFITLAAERLEVGPLTEVRFPGRGRCETRAVLQQETRLFQDGQCVCVLLVTYPPGSPEWMKWAAARTLDSAPRAAEPIFHHPV